MKTSRNYTVFRVRPFSGGKRALLTTGSTGEEGKCEEEEVYHEGHEGHKGGEEEEEEEETFGRGSGWVGRPLHCEKKALRVC